MHFIQLYSKWQYSDRRKAVYSIFLLSLTCLLNLLISGFITNTHAATIIGAEYFIDTDPGEGLGMPISPPEGGAFDSTMEEVEFVVDTSTLKIGHHTIYVRMKNGDGVWGVARPIPNDLELAAPYNLTVEGTKTITAAEYFIGADLSADPGTGNGIQISLPADGSFNSGIEDLEIPMDTTGLAAGLHTIYVRVRDSNGDWGDFFASRSCLHLGGTWRR